MADIRIDLINIRNQVQRLNAAQSELNTELRRLDSVRAEIANAWQGTAADTFKRKLNAEYEQLKRLSAFIGSVAGSIEATAERIRKQEEALAQETQKL